MSDNKQFTGKADRDRVSASEPYEVEDLHQKYPSLTHQEVLDAIKAAGPMRKDIIAYLDKKKGA